MSYQLIFKRLAQIELEEVLAWYGQLFYSIDGNVVNVHYCFHQSRNPKTRAQMVQ